MKKAVSLLLVSGFLAQTSFASTMTDRMIESKEILGIVFEDDKTGEKCLASENEQIIASLNLSACTDDQKEKMKEINDAPKNPDTAIVGSIAGLVGSYYVLCSSIQAAPYLFNKMIEGSDDRTRTEKIKDFFNPSEEQRKIKAAKSSLESFSEDVSTTICSPVTAANEKLMYIMSDKKAQ